MQKQEFDYSAARILNLEDCDGSTRDIGLKRNLTQSVIYSSSQATSC